jgi:hypothetical protein
MVLERERGRRGEGEKRRRGEGERRRGGEEFRSGSKIYSLNAKQFKTS